MEYWDIEILRYWDIGILRYWNIDILEYWEIGIFRYWNIEKFEYLDIGILRYWNIEILEHWDIGILRYYKIEILECMSQFFFWQNWTDFDQDNTVSLPYWLIFSLIHSRYCWLVPPTQVTAQSQYLHPWDQPSNCWQLFAQSC